MNGTAAIDTPRLIRIATLLLALAAGALVFFSYAPRIDLAQQRLDDDAAMLQSSEIAVREMGEMRASRDALARRYDPLFAKNSEAVFIADLDAIAARRRVTLVSTSTTHEVAASNERISGSILRGTHVGIELRGTYRRVLAAITDLSLGSEIVRVDEPTLRRRDDDIEATIPVTLFEPALGGPR